jgi:Flp pilus assembly protein protease CpaA
VEFLYQVFILALFSAGGFSDVMKREVKDELTILLWLACAIFLSTASLQLTIFSFCLIWAIATFGEKFKIQVFGWGDVLWGAPFIGVVSDVADVKLAFILFGLCFSAGQFYLHWQTQVKKIPKKKVRGVPFVAYLAAALLLSMLL